MCLIVWKLERSCKRQLPLKVFIWVSRVDLHEGFSNWILHVSFEKYNVLDGYLDISNTFLMKSDVIWCSSSSSDKGDNWIQLNFHCQKVLLYWRNTQRAQCSAQNSKQRSPLFNGYWIRIAIQGVCALLNTDRGRFWWLQQHKTFLLFSDF